ncbi:hypothetical protein BDY24DRAFT_397839 [Mrakia frigida]|uniref:uncharacterized protein n=1 Tax=Mrakia frigida TaxID=29902 RepID=UPI003FCBF3FE
MLYPPFALFKSTIQSIPQAQHYATQLQNHLSHKPADPTFSDIEEVWNLVEPFDPSPIPLSAFEEPLIKKGARGREDPRSALYLGLYLLTRAGSDPLLVNGSAAYRPVDRFMKKEEFYLAPGMLELDLLAKEYVKLYEEAIQSGEAVSENAFIVSMSKQSSILLEYDSIHGVDVGDAGIPGRSRIYVEVPSSSGVRKFLELLKQKGNVSSNRPPLLLPPSPPLLSFSSTTNPPTLVPDSLVMVSSPKLTNFSLLALQWNPKLDDKPWFHFQFFPSSSTSLHSNKKPSDLDPSEAERILRHLVALYLSRNKVWHADSFRNALGQLGLRFWVRSTTKSMTDRSELWFKEVFEVVKGTKSPKQDNGEAWTKGIFGVYSRLNARGMKITIVIGDKLDKYIPIPWADELLSNPTFIAAQQAKQGGSRLTEMWVHQRSIDDDVAFNRVRDERRATTADAVCAIKSCHFHSTTQDPDYPALGMLKEFYPHPLRPNAGIFVCEAHHIELRITDSLGGTVEQTESFVNAGTSTSPNVDQLFPTDFTLWFTGCSSGKCGGYFNVRKLTSSVSATLGTVPSMCLTCRHDVFENIFQPHLEVNQKLIEDLAPGTIVDRRVHLLPVPTLPDLQPGVMECAADGCVNQLRLFTNGKPCIGNRNERGERVCPSHSSGAHRNWSPSLNQDQMHIAIDALASSPTLPQLLKLAQTLTPQPVQPAGLLRALKSTPLQLNSEAYRKFRGFLEGLREE